MQETFLHFVWQYQYFDKKELSTTNGQKIEIKRPGHINSDAGPDFKEGKLSIDEIDWNGSVEIHVKSSEWDQHQHQTDEAYNNVILHVVWQHNKEVKRADGSIIPVLELQHRIDCRLIEKYEKLVKSPVLNIPCENHFSQVEEVIKLATLDSMVMQRLYEKSVFIEEILKKNKGDWEETAYQLLAKNLGLKVNAEPFHILSECLPFKIVKKHSTDIKQIEALLFGIAGFLDDEINDEYHNTLVTEYRYLKHKYNLDQKLNKFRWKFLRLRPANFPTLRIAQLASILHDKQSVFDIFLTNGVNELAKWLRRPPSAYWHNHYNFETSSDAKIGGIGLSTVENIVINTVAPLLVAYGKQIDNQDYIDRGVTLLQELKPENNKITRIWEALNFKPTSGLDSQAQIQLYNNYCIRKNCLRCSIGNSILRP
jgi:hypothetical protein